MAHRDFRAELDAAAKDENWEAHSRIWEERRCAEVDYDERRLASPVDWTGIREIHARCRATVGHPMSEKHQ